MTRFYPDMPAISTYTQGGHLAVVSHIEPSSDDCIGGYIINPKTEPSLFEVEWNLNGECRNNLVSANIDMEKAIKDDPRFSKLVDIIERTRASKS